MEKGNKIRKRKTLRSDAMNCRQCGEDISEPLDMFMHNDIRNCKADSVIEYIEQTEDNARRLRK